MSKHVQFFMKLPFREKLLVVAFLFLLVLLGGTTSNLPAIRSVAEKISGETKGEPSK